MDVLLPTLAWFILSGLHPESDETKKDSWKARPDIRQVAAGPGPRGQAVQPHKGVNMRDFIWNLIQAHKGLGGISWRHILVLNRVFFLGFWFYVQIFCLILRFVYVKNVFF